MKNIISISLIALFAAQTLAPNMDLCCELEKLPNLLAHFEEHKSYDDDSFFQFLVEDYLGDSGEEQGHHDTNEHDDLPFQGQHHCSHAPVQCLLLPMITFGISFHAMQTDFAVFIPSLSSEYLDTPFQPPKG